MKEHNLSDEDILVQLARNPELLEVLYHRWGRRWAGLMVTAGVAFQDIDDVLQAILLEVWRHAKRFNPKKGSAEAWLLQIARFRTIDHMRRQKPAAEELTAALADQRQTWEATEARAWIQDALTALTAREAQAIQLLYYYGFTQKEIAAMWHVPQGTVKSWIRRGLAKLRQQWAEERG
ncbi:MAG: sigma-70 family RNA polymerase sigma factor [Firmicutes bacterium]|nr:sigma-70 family RNA polymerase sigma factor [Bacillota bacterium]